VGGVAGVALELAGDLGELQRGVPQLAVVGRYDIGGDQVVDAGGGVLGAVAGVVEKADGVRSGGAHAAHVLVHRLVQAGEAGVADRDDLEAEGLECLLQQRDVVVRVGEPADFGQVGLVADE
jgi:hypothetical protein